MFFELNNTTYGVKFTREGTTTLATLYKVLETGELVETNVVGKAILYYKDKFEKAKGRKIALADLLWQVRVPDEESEILPEGLTKEDRAKIWEIYFETHKR